MVRNITKDENREYIRSYIEEASKVKMDVQKLSIDRWEDFKRRRVSIVDCWIKALKLKKKAEFWVKHSALTILIAVLYENFKVKRIA
jgi:hypothetical protein